MLIKHIVKKSATITLPLIQKADKLQWRLIKFKYLRIGLSEMYPGHMLVVQECNARWANL